MANTLTGRMWVLDTAEAVTTEAVKVKSIRWVSESASAGHNVVISDSDGKVLWEATAPGANQGESEIIENWWKNGFTLTTLDSGKVYVAIE
jgi:hypothetical protein